jgi:hypothetical protein
VATPLCAGAEVEPTDVAGADLVTTIDGMAKKRRGDLQTSVLRALGKPLTTRAV